MVVASRHAERSLALFWRDGVEACPAQHTLRLRPELKNVRDCAQGDDEHLAITKYKQCLPLSEK